LNKRIRNANKNKLSKLLNAKQRRR